MPNVDDSVMGRQMPSSFDENHEFYNEKPMAKIFRKLREEPLIPLGAGLTVFAFTQAWRAMRRGDQVAANKMFRARVAAQGFTVLAMIAGSMYYNKDREATKELRKLKEERDNEEKRQKWIRELEIRDEEDKAMRARVMNRRAKAEEAKAGSASATPAEGGEAKSGVMNALGLSGSSSGWGKPGEAPAADASKAVDEEPIVSKVKTPTNVKRVSAEDDKTN
ncbi:Pre-mRNA-splicing factor SPP2 [Verticillium dahliae VDG1]|nr:Pre-mRNA-splicing factor SPP2 [Verticillium dahliae VDG1]